MRRIKTSNKDRTPPTINRFAVILEPTEKYVEWAKASPEGDDDTAAELLEDCTVYLLPEMFDDLDKWIEENYMAMFKGELESWCIDENFWPEDMSFKAFKSYFNFRHHSIVVDMAEDDIVWD